MARRFTRSRRPFFRLRLLWTLGHELRFLCGLWLWRTPVVASLQRPEGGSSSSLGCFQSILLEQRIGQGLVERHRRVIVARRACIIDSPVSTGNVSANCWVHSPRRVSTRRAPAGRSPRCMASNLNNTLSRMYCSPSRASYSSPRSTLVWTYQLQVHIRSSIHWRSVAWFSS